MAEVINLRRARKARDRAAEAAAADLARAAHGRSKTDRVASAAENARRERILDAAKREE